MLDIKELKEKEPCSNMVFLAIFKKGARPNVHPRYRLKFIKKAIRTSIFPGFS